MVNPDVYLRPDIVIELALKDEIKFIKLMKDNNVRNLVPIIGYQYLPELILKSGRKVTTASWNILTFALVLGRESLFNFIVKDINLNLK